MTAKALISKTNEILPINCIKKTDFILKNIKFLQKNDVHKWAQFKCVFFYVFVIMKVNRQIPLSLHAISVSIFWQGFLNQNEITWSTHIIRRLVAYVHTYVSVEIHIHVYISSLQCQSRIFRIKNIWNKILYLLINNIK